MLHDLFLNAVIIIAFLSVFNQILIHNKVQHISPLIAKILFGVFAGLLGCILMVYTVHISDTVLLDFRIVPITLSSIYGGIIPTVTSAAIIGTFRMLYFGADLRGRRADGE